MAYIVITDEGFIEELDQSELITILSLSSWHPVSYSNCSFDDKVDLWDLIFFIIDDLILIELPWHKPETDVIQELLVLLAFSILESIEELSEFEENVLPQIVGHDRSLH